MNYLYPRNLKETPTLWLWSFKDIGIIGVGAIIAVLVFTLTQVVVPLLIVGVFAFLTIRFGDTTMMNFIQFAIAYFITESQMYHWKAHQEINEKRKEIKKHER